MRAPPSYERFAGAATATAAVVLVKAVLAPKLPPPACRVTVVLPSGAGKTVLALFVAEALCAPVTVVLVPSLALISQSYRDWERWRAVPGRSYP